MKLFFIFLVMIASLSTNAQYVGPPNNVGREYGNPKMPFMVSHLAGANKKMLERATKNSKHSIFGKVLCFRRLCRIQSGHTSSLRAISFRKFRKKVAKNAKKDLYKNNATQPVRKADEVKPPPVVKDTVNTKAKPVPIVRADSLIVLGAELLFETNRSTIRAEHFSSLNSIVTYLLTHPDRSVKISGHTDNTGTEGNNISLSKRRADVVAEYLVDNGVDISRVETSGLGSARPIAENTNENGRKKNRRVELLIHNR